MTRPKVAVLRTKPETVLDDYRRLGELAGVRDALDPGVPTILKDPIARCRCQIVPRRYHMGYSTDTRTV